MPRAAVASRAQRPLLLRVAAALTLAGCLAAGCGRARPLRVVLITLDTVRADALTGAGGGVLLPRIRARAERGRIFEQAFSASCSTGPAHATLFTGLHPWEHGVTSNGLALSAHPGTVPQILAERGFETAAVVASVPLSRRFGFARGFRAFDEPFTEWFGGSWEGALLDGPFFALGPTVTEQASRRLDVLSSPRQFLWVHYFDAHSPYGDAAGAGQALTPAEVRRRCLAASPGLAEDVGALYAADLGALDRSVDRLLDRLERDASDVDTHVVVTADHGESLGEDRVLGHGNHLTAEQLRIPLFILSSRVAPGRETAPVGSIDVGTTLLSLAGVSTRLPSGRDLTSRSLPRAVVVGARRSYAAPLETVRADGTVDLHSGRLFYLADEDRGLNVGNGSMLVGARPGDPWTHGVTALFRSFESRLDGREPGASLDPASRRALEALGYVR